MRPSLKRLAVLAALIGGVLSQSADTDNVTADQGGSRDLCAKVASAKKWVAPKDVRACFKSFALDEKIRSNIIEVVSKTLPFHTSVNYQRNAPAPFTDVHEDLPEDIEKISKKNYDSEYDMHVELSRAFKRLFDGHAWWENYCYDNLYVNYLPLPLSLISDKADQQTVHIAYEAFDVAKAEFPDQVDFWQDSLPGSLKGQLATLSGAEVLEINGKDPWDAVEANTAITGNYQAHSTRQNAYFASYQRSTTGWNYRMGDFALQTLPLTDEVTLKVLRLNETKPSTFTIPYRSRIGPNAVNFTDTKSWRQTNCVAVNDTNGVDAYATKAKSTGVRKSRKLLINQLLDESPLVNVALPPSVAPANPLNASRSVNQFYLLDDKKTGVLALGSFADGIAGYNGQIATLLDGLQTLKASGATQLIVDVTNNGGGYICVAHWLHRIIAGPKASTEPQAGLYTTARAGPLARLISKTINSNMNATDPDNLLLYNSINWAYANNTIFPESYDWLDPAVSKVINGHNDSFSQRLGTDCPAELSYNITAPPAGLFDPKKVAIVSNGRCASSCSLFSITMAKEEGAKTVVVGGKGPQQYCGTVGGQSTDFSTIDTEIKTAKLKDSPLAPPDLIVNAGNGITWRLGYGVLDPSEPEEWQSRPADVSLLVTPELSNNPVAIWAKIAKEVLT